MKRGIALAIMAFVPLLTAAMWMDRQPSIKPYEAPILMPPADSVPVTGREPVPQDTDLNPNSAYAESIARGKALFAINCVICHGQTSAERGPVGKKLVPPPPGLDSSLLQGLSDGAIFKAVTLGFGRMPPFRDKLLPLERWDLVKFLRTRK
jgi:mono/diheme cytochrome c family protein